MRRSTVLFIALVTAAATLFVVAQDPVATLSGFSKGDWSDVLAFAFVGLLSQAAAIDFGRDRQSASSMAFIPFLASAILLPPLGSVIVGTSVIAISEFAFSRRALLKGVFNIAQSIVAIGLAANVYHRIAGTDFLAGVDPIAFTGLVATFFGINMLLTSFAISQYRHQSFFPTLVEVTGPRGGNIVYDVFASWIVVLAVFAYAQYNFGGIFVMVVSLLVIRHVYFSRRKLEEANHDLLTVLVKAIETRDPYTSGHSIRVSTLAALIAEDLGLSRRKIDKIRRAALLHDIGKIDPVYEEVLKKPHGLSPEERELIQTHAARGADLLQKLSSVDSDIILAVRHHHERFDGKGYPDGLVGNDIPLTARIIMMCDSIDAMLSDRPYRAALTVSAVKLELERCSGMQFDPEVAAVVVREGTLERAVSLVEQWKDKVEARVPAYENSAEMAIPTLVALPRSGTTSPRVA